MAPVPNLVVGFLFIYYVSPTIRTVVFLICPKLAQNEMATYWKHFKKLHCTLVHFETIRRTHLVPSAMEHTVTYASNVTYFQLCSFRKPLKQAFFPKIRIKQKKLFAVTFEGNWTGKFHHPLLQISVISDYS